MSHSGRTGQLNVLEFATSVILSTRLFLVIVGGEEIEFLFQNRSAGNYVSVSPVRLRDSIRCVHALINAQSDSIDC